jgi:hypothetical protein
LCPPPIKCESSPSSAANVCSSHRSFRSRASRRLQPNQALNWTGAQSTGSHRRARRGPPWSSAPVSSQYWSVEIYRRSSDSRERSRACFGKRDTRTSSKRLERPRPMGHGVSAGGRLAVETTPGGEARRLTRRTTQGARWWALRRRAPSRATRPPSNWRPS